MPNAHPLPPPPDVYQTHNLSFLFPFTLQENDEDEGRLLYVGLKVLPCPRTLKPQFVFFDPYTEKETTITDLERSFLENTIEGMGPDWRYFFRPNLTEAIENAATALAEIISMGDKGEGLATPDAYTLMYLLCAVKDLSRLGGRI